MGNNFEKIKEKLEGNEQLALESMLQGESVVETARSLAVSVQEAQALRKAVYCAAEEFVEFGNNTKGKQQKLIDFCKNNETKFKPFCTIEEDKFKKITEELEAAKNNLKPFEDDYFKGLTHAEIAELAKKSFRLTEENSKLTEKIERIEKIELPKITNDGSFLEYSKKANENLQAIGGLFFKICEMLNLDPKNVDLEDAAKEIELSKERSNTEPDFGNFLVYNPEKGCPNKVYKNINTAIEDGKSVARKEQQRVFVLRIASVITPNCYFNIQDVSQSGIPSKYMQKDEIPF